MEEQKLRDFIWQSIPPKKEIVAKVLLKSIKADGKSSKDDMSQHYQVELSAELAKRSYIYIDFPFMVDDGGYYYSIDLATFLAEYEKHTNQ